MGKVVFDMSMSLDGFIAGPKDDSNPDRELGALDIIHDWMFPPKGNFEEIAGERFRNVGAVVMGRRMFDPGEGPWGDNPVFHAPVFVLSHNPREKVVKQGGTTCTFITDGIESALEQARTAAGDEDIMVAGGARAIQQYLKAGLLDELHLTLVHVLLGEGIRLFEEIGTDQIKLEKISVIDAPGDTHFRFRALKQGKGKLI